MNSREMVMGAATGIVVVTALGWTFAVRPLVDRWTSARDKRDTLQDSLDKALALVKRKDELQTERDRIDRRLGAEVERVAFGGSAVFGFLEHLNDLTRASGFAAKELKFVRSDVLDAYAECKFTLIARAPLHKIVDFLVRMSASDFYLRVQALQVQPKENGEIEADMTLVGLVLQDMLADDELPKEVRDRRAREAAGGKAK